MMGPWYTVSTVGALGQPGVGLGPPHPAVYTVTGHRDRGTTPWPQLCILTSQDSHCQRLGVTTPDDLIWNGKTNHLETSPAMGQVWDKFNLERKPQRKTHLCVTSRNVSSPQLVWFLSPSWLIEVLSEEGSQLSPGVQPWRLCRWMRDLPSHLPSANSIPWHDLSPGPEMTMASVDIPNVVWLTS